MKPSFFQDTLKDRLLRAIDSGNKKNVEEILKYDNIANCRFEDHPIQQDEKKCPKNTKLPLTPLARAVVLGFVDIVKILFAYNAKIDHFETNGQPLLAYALSSEKNNTEMVKILILHGAP